MANSIPTYEEFITEYPVLVPPAVSEIDVQRQLDFAARLLCRTAWGDWYSDGILVVSAHHLSMWLKTQSAVNGGAEGASGNVSFVSGAGLSISFEESSANKSSPAIKSDLWYNRTLYGQQYLYLRSLVVPSAGLSA